MNKRKLEFMELFIKGKIDYRTYNRIIIYLDLMEKEYN